MDAKGILRQLRIVRGQLDDAIRIFEELEANPDDLQVKLRAGVALIRMMKDRQVLNNLLESPGGSGRPN